MPKENIAPNETEATRTINIALPESVHRELKVECAKSDLQQAEVVTAALRKYFGMYQEDETRG
jgi:hypothetical protein